MFSKKSEDALNKVPWLISASTMDVDEALKVVDPNNRRQWIYMAILCAHALPGAMVLLVMEFAAHIPPFECHREGVNGTEILIDACFNDTTIQCGTIQFGHSYTSVVSEWSLVCDRASEAHALQSFFMAGMAAASLPVGPLADGFGRRNLVLLGSGLQAVLTAALGLSPNYGTFAALRFLTGLLQAAGLANWTWVSEMVRTPLRSRAGLIGSVLFSAGITFLALSAFLITSWRWLLVFTGAVASLSVVLTGAVVPPSARWLLQRGRTQEARQVLLGLARANGLPPPSDLSLPAPRQETNGTSDTCCSMFSRSRAAL